MSDKVFEQHLEELSVFQAYYGIRSPSRKDKNPSIAKLGRWAHRTRRAYRNGELDISRIERLKKFNFEFSQNKSHLWIDEYKRQSFTAVLTKSNNGIPLSIQDVALLNLLSRAFEYDFLIDEHLKLFLDFQEKLNSAVELCA